MSQPEPARKDGPRPIEPRESMRAEQEARAKAWRFLWLQAFFLFVSIFTGGFHFSVWSMADTAMLLLSIGVTGLLLVIDDDGPRRLVFKTAVALYMLAIVDMSINVLVSGALGWKT